MRFPPPYTSRHYTTLKSNSAAVKAEESENHFDESEALCNHLLMLKCKMHMLLLLKIAALHIVST